MKKNFKIRRQGNMSEVRKEIYDWLKTFLGFNKEPGEKLNCVRISRNLEGFPFACQATTEQKDQISREILKACRCCLPDFKKDYCILKWQECNTTERELLISTCFLEDPTDDTLLVFKRNKNVFIVLNDCDHIRFQWIDPDSVPRLLWQQLNVFDALLEENLSYSFDPEKGYNTCSLDTRGTGVKIFSLVHIPAICYKQQLNQVVAALEAMSLKLEPYAKIEDRVLGHLFFVTNTTSLGCSEETLVDHVEKTVQTVITKENQAREALLGENKNFIKDSVGRSLGVLRSCYELSFEEAMNLFSIVVMAMDLGLVNGKKRTALMKLWYSMRFERLQQYLKEDFDYLQEKQVRADVVRKFFLKNEDFCLIEAKKEAYVS